MTVASYQLLRDDGVPIPAFRVQPALASTAARISLAIMVAEAPTPFAHRLLFVMADGSRVIAKPKTTNP